MAIITTNGSFGATAAVTSTTLNAVADAATFSDPVDGTSLELKVDGKLGIKDAGVTKAKIENISAPLRVLGRTTAGAGVAEEVTINDDDDLSSASAITLATDRSIKAYVDSITYTPNIVQAVKTDTFTQLNPANAWFDIPDLSLSITPTSSSSKVLISADVSSSSSTENFPNLFRFVRDDVAIALADAAGARTQCSFTSGSRGKYTSVSNGMSYLDSTAVVAGTPVVYKIQCSNYSTVDIFINRGYTDTSAIQYARAISTLIATEIPQ